MEPEEVKSDVDLEKLLHDEPVSIEGMPTQEEITREMTGKKEVAPAKVAAEPGAPVKPDYSGLPEPFQFIIEDLSTEDKPFEVPKEVIHKAAELAAKNSRGQGKTKVVWTKAKYVTKDKEQKLGEVYVDYGKSHFITIYV